MRLEIAFYTEGLEFDEDLAVTGPLGGSETAVGMLARALALMGHKVRVFCNTNARGKAGKLPNGVEYCTYKLWPKMSKVMRPDVFITSRNLTGLMIDPWPETGMTYLWMHDIMTLDYEKALFSWLPAIDKVIVNSRYAYHQAFKASPGLRDFERESSRQRHDFMKVISLGLNQDDLPQFKDRDHRRLLYSSRPERGLASALDVLDRLNEKRSKLDKYTLAVGGYDVSPNMLHPNMVKFYKQLERRMQMNPNVDILEKRTRKDLYHEMARCHALLYPTDFPEIFCLTVLEAQACGLPVVTTADYALRETAPSAAFIPAFPEDKNYIEKAAETVEALDSDKGKWATHSKAGLQHVSMGGESFAYDWSEIAKEWDAMFTQDFRQRVQRNPVGVALALYKDSDLIACQDFLKNPGDFGANIIPEKQEAADKLLDQVTKDIGFLEDPKAYKEHYTSSENGRKGKDILTNRAANNRVMTMVDVVGREIKVPDKFKMLDWGANLGVLSLCARDKFPDAKIVAFDLDPDIADRGEKWCKEIYEKEGKPDPDIAWISSADQLAEVKFDLIVLAEVLEHVLDPKAFLEQEVLPHLDENGWLLISTPAGPWEFDSYKTDPKRFHVRRYRNLDIEDVMMALGAPAMMMSTAMHAGEGIEGDSLGWLILGFQVGKRVVPEFEYRRHILTVRPRQTLTACIITKDRPWQLQRMLSTVRPIVDQLVICDTGSTDEHAIKLEKEAADIWFKGPDPLTVGFGPTREASIKPATGDWILWIDSDEWLDPARKLRKYLRENPMAGYILFQQNLTLDGAHKNPDTPCRLFRRNGGARFIGYIHEQAEFDYDVPIAPSIPLGDVSILHDSYYKDENRSQRFQRNLPLLLKEGKEMPQRLMTKVLLMRDYAQYGIHQINSGNSPAGMANLKQVLKLYDEHFKKDLFAGKYFSYAFRFYQEAVRATGLGFGVAQGMVATANPENQDQQIPLDVNMLIFRTVDEAVDYIAAMSRDGMQEAYRRKHGDPPYHKRPGDRTIAKKSAGIGKEQR